MNFQRKLLSALALTGALLAGCRTSQTPVAPPDNTKYTIENTD